MRVTWVFVSFTLLTMKRVFESGIEVLKGSDTSVSVHVEADSYVAESGYKFVTLTCGCCMNVRASVDLEPNQIDQLIFLLKEAKSKL